MSPELGVWYLVRGERCQVVSADHDERVLELQYEDGGVEEVTLEDWDEACAAGQVELA